MNVYLNSIDGIPDAIEAMFFSKRTWTQKIHEEVREACRIVLNTNGSYSTLCEGSYAYREELKNFKSWIEKVCKMTVEHITVGKFIDFSFIVEGLHRAGQDDWDSHAQRFDNRIIRSSTRLSEFGNEKSAFYEGKILTMDEVLDIMGITISDRVIANDGRSYVKTVNGYIREDLKDDKDVKRGLYMLSIPSNFIFRVNLTQFAHVYKERNKDSNANPEVRECAEKCADLIEQAFPWFTRKLLLSIKN